MEFESVDITNLDIATLVHGSVLAHYYSAQLAAIAETAERLGYRFVRTEIGDTVPPIVKRSLARAVAKRKRELDSPYDLVKASDLAESDVEVGFADSLMDAILDSLASAGVRLCAAAGVEDVALRERDHSDLDAFLVKVMSSNFPVAAAADAVCAQDAVTKDAPSQEVGQHQTAPRAEFVVNVVKEEVFVSGDGVFAAFNWKPRSWHNTVKGVSVLESGKPTDQGSKKRYSVVAGEEGEEGKAIVRDLSKEEATELVRRIEAAVTRYVGIPSMTDSHNPSRVGGALWPVLRIFARPSIIVALCAVAVSFALLFAFKAGGKLASKAFPEQRTGLVGDHPRTLTPIPPALPCGLGCANGSGPEEDTIQAVGPKVKK